MLGIEISFGIVILMVIVLIVYAYTHQYVIITDDGSMTTSQLLHAVGGESYWSDRQLDSEFPSPSTPTSRKFRWQRKADRHLKNLSAEDLEKRVECINIRERLIYEGKWFQKKGTYLDKKTTTLCAGSRDSRDRVPSVHLYDGKVSVYYCATNAKDSALRAREVIS